MSEYSNDDDPGDGLPVGFCDHCIAAMADGDIDAIMTMVGAHAVLVGLFCPENRTIAVGVQINGEDIAEWKTLSPATEEKLVEMMADIAGMGEAELAKQRHSLH